MAGESGGEFLSLYRRLISYEHWKCYLAIKGVLPTIGLYISREIEELTVLEETTLSSDLSQGYALKALTGSYSMPFLSFIRHANLLSCAHVLV